MEKNCAWHRLEAGLSQRALCGDEITRNMLSRIENGAARPSMKTLRFLAARLDKPVSYFLEEDTVCSPNQESMTAARRLFDGEDYAGAMQALAQYRAPDEIYDREKRCWKSLSGSTLPRKPSQAGGRPTLWSCWKPLLIPENPQPIIPRIWSSADFCSLAAFRGRPFICPVWMKR